MQAGPLARVKDRTGLTESVLFTAAKTRYDNVAIPGLTNALKTCRQLLSLRRRKLDQL